MRDDEALRRTSPLTVGLLVLQGVIGVATGFFVLFRRIEVPHCHLSCDFALLDATGNLYVLATIILFAASFAAVSFGRGRVWWAPTAGIAITIVAAIAAHRLSDIALLFA